jgi:hypothetical protein
VSLSTGEPVCLCDTVPRRAVPSVTRCDEISGRCQCPTS